MPTNTATYEIVDGVRRTVATYMAGKQVIRAQILDDDGHLGSPISIAIDAIRSGAKMEIDISSAAGAIRWSKVQAEVARGMAYPIMVRLESMGCRVAVVRLV